MLVRNKPIFRVKQVEEAVKQEANLEVNRSQVAKFMRKDMHLGYRHIRTVPVQSNTQRCLVLRQQYALRMLPLLESRRRIINVDESWMNNTRFINKMWVPSGAAATITEKQVQPRISLLVAIDTDGRIYFTLT